MVGICSTLGEIEEPPEAMVEYIGWGADEEQISYQDGGFDLRARFHSLLADDAAIAADGHTHIWVWGDVYGYGSRSNYVPRKGPPHGSAKFCAHLYEVFGMEFVSGLNGNFALIIYDEAANTVSFVTDRFSTRPLYYAQPSDDAFLVSSHSQSLGLHPAFDPAFEPSYLYEYLTLRSVFGVKTPIKGCEELPPGSIVTIDLNELTMETTNYWSPSHDPIDKPFSYFLDEFTEIILTLFEEWTRDDLSYGLLLSGGSDSRLGLAAIDQPVTAFHNADWMSREAKIAQRAANASGDRFRLLERGPEYDAGLLENAPPLSNFSGWFDQAYFLGFEEEINADIDVLVSGLYADMLFGGGPLSTWSVSLGEIGNVSLPVVRSIDSIEDFVGCQTAEAIEPVPYFRDDWSADEILSENIYQDGTDIVNHGVRYNSLQDLVMYSEFYPLNADTDMIFSTSLAQMRPYRTPFLDTRLVDLQQQMPKKYFVRKNIVNRAIDRITPELAEIPHAHTGVPLKYPYSLSFLGKNLYGFWWEHVQTDDIPEPHLDHSPWPNREELIRAREFVSQTLDSKENLLTDSELLDGDGAWECYYEHLDGTNNTPIIYTLLTLLQMPITERIHRQTKRTNGEHSGRRRMKSISEGDQRKSISEGDP